MSKTIYSYQEISALIEQGTSVTFRRQLEAHVTTIQPCPDCGTITAILQLSLGDSFLGEVECEFATIVGLLNAFAIDERAELWEVVQETRSWRRDHGGFGRRCDVTL
jgi:hypothetical protein